MQRVAQGLDTAIAPVCLRYIPLWKSTGTFLPGLETRRIGIAAAMIADLARMRCESFPCSRQRSKDLAIRMGQKAEWQTLS